MATQRIVNTNPQLLASLIDAPKHLNPVWDDADLKDILSHQLSSPLIFDIQRLCPGDGKTVIGMNAASAQKLQTFRDLFQLPSPPLDLLRTVKDFGKSADAASDFSLPTPIALVIYYAAITAALVRHKVSISGLDNQKLRDGLRWARQQPWLEESMHALFGEGLRAIDEGGLPARG